MITLGGSLFVVALLVGFAALALRKRAQQAQSALKWRRNFYEHATILVKDERTPKHIVNILEFMGQGIASRLLLWELITFSDNRPAEVAQDHRREIGAMIENLPPDIKENL